MTNSRFCPHCWDTARESKLRQCVFGQALRVRLKHVLDGNIELPAVFVAHADWAPNGLTTIHKRAKISVMRDGEAYTHVACWCQLRFSDER